jgi:protein-S-isoprenylcysteine O-methyltransferase Ste14
MLGDCAQRRRRLSQISQAITMFPILVTVYVRLARREEAEVREAFGQAWDDYAARTPAFVPRLQRPATGSVESESGAHV